ncbi:germin-like protein subfamily 3 member 4 [Malania oleifera]|uniref:germin-like protein subfamily 3 member 4 n=1 Tax=Malania oleifera TaxID=397392 RepID=UPI0025AE7110|nr:germin-like protein subfamily 3 member 4 [Malania oleifera]
MNPSLLFHLTLSVSGFFAATLAGADNLQDVCPTALPNPGRQPLFINGFPCKNPADVAASDFKTNKLNLPGDMDPRIRSAVSMSTAADFPGLNTLGISVARTDVAAGGIVLPHYHPRASEMMFVSKGSVRVGFVDSGGQAFGKLVREGEVFVFPRGLIHYCYNGDNEAVTAFSVLNSQNPGVYDILGGAFGFGAGLQEEEDIKRMMMNLSMGSNLNETAAGF